MTNSGATAYEFDMSEEAAGLLRFAQTRLPEGLSELDVKAFDRIVLTGMGGSDYATIPLELCLAQAGLPVWRLLSSRLLEMRALITADTLLVIISQSGRSGEVLALLEQLERRPKAMIVVTNDATSPLALAADHLVLLACGPEATVATKTYANTLAACHRLAGLLLERTDTVAVGEIRAAADSLQTHIDRGTPTVDALAERMPGRPKPRLVLIGGGPDAATALAGAMVLKEAAKVAAEGFVGGAFRHGPLELAGPGLTAILFGRGSGDEPSPHALARDLLATGSTVVSVAPVAYEGSDLIAIPGTTDLERLLHGMYVVQRLSVGLARAAGLVPGAFLYGQKITAQL